MVGLSQRARRSRWSFLFLWNFDSSGPVVTLRIHHPTLTFVHGVPSDAAGHGIIAGVLDTQELIDAFFNVYFADPALCAHTGIPAQFRSIQDILEDGNQRFGRSV